MLTCALRSHWLRNKEHVVKISRDYQSWYWGNLWHLESFCVHEHHNCGVWFYQSLHVHREISDIYTLTQRRTLPAAVPLYSFDRQDPILTEADVCFQKFSILIQRRYVPASDLLCSETQEECLHCKSSLHSSSTDPAHTKAPSPSPFTAAHWSVFLFNEFSTCTRISVWISISITSVWIFFSITSVRIISSITARLHQSEFRPHHYISSWFHTHECINSISTRNTHTLISLTWELARNPSFSHDSYETQLQVVRFIISWRFIIHIHSTISFAWDC